MMERIGAVGDRAVKYLLGVFKDAVCVGGRQFFLVWCVLNLIALLRVTEYLSEDGFMTVMISVVGAYIVGNSVQHMASVKAGNAPPAGE